MGVGIMKAKIFNKGLLKKINPKKIFKQATILITTVAIPLNLTACSIFNLGTHAQNKPSSSKTEVVPEIPTTPLPENVTIDDSAVPSLDNDPSEKYTTMYVGDGKDLSIGNPNNFQEYKDNDNAFTRKNTTIENTIVSINPENKQDLLDLIDSQKSTIPYSDLFNLEHLFEKLNNEIISTTHYYEFEFDVNGLVDANNLYQIVLANNLVYPVEESGFTSFNDAKLKTICAIVASTLNEEIKNNPYVDKSALACNLSSFKILGEQNVTNARITYDNVLAINESMIDTIKSPNDNTVDAYTQTIMHESKHIPQLNCDDEIDKTTGNRIGFNRKWADEPINSLFWNWYYEASAETMTTNDTGGDNIVYENKTNYLKFLKLTCLPDPDFKVNSIEQASTSRNPDDFYRIFGLTTKEDKVEFAKIMYAIELIQNQNREFEKIYTAYKGHQASTIDAEEWLQIKLEMKCSLATNLSRMFYKNLIKYVESGNATLYDVYRLITVYEAEIEQHILYDSTTKFQVNASFMESYSNIQKAFFSTLNTGLNYSTGTLLEGYNTYSMASDQTVTGLSVEANNFLANREHELIKHMTTSIASTYENYIKYLGNKKTLSYD